MKRTLQLLIFILLSGCLVQQPVTREDSSELNSNCPSGGNCSTSDNGGIDDNSDDEPVAKVEIRHLIDPFDGTYQRKLTLPKNYRGEFYVSGLNLQTIRDRHLYVRFKFGMAKEEIIYAATLGRGQGITPDTGIDVLILDLSQPDENGRRFEDIRLIYDLFDYNDYDFAGGDQAVTDNRDLNLFCRGLFLEDDPTFQGSGSCSASSSECRYGYAKVLDKGLMKDSGGGLFFPEVSLLQNIDFSGSGYGFDTVDRNLRKCLAEDPNLYLPNYHQVFDGNNTAINFNGFGAGNIVNISGTDYYYNGPYRSLNQGLWQISGDAMFGQYGLFRGSLTAGDAETGYGSYLFPRYNKMTLASGTQHISGTIPDQAKALVSTFPTSGETNWMDGCNMRASTLNLDSNEHIGSCNVSATIEILEKDLTTGQFTVIAGELDGGRDVKLQLTRASETDTEGNEVLYSSLNQCENSSACGNDECCFNNRCWSDEIVSICPEDAPSSGNLGIGQTCSTDFDCTSLCCSPTSGRCEVHNNSLDPAVLCSKPPGQLCIAKEWCMKQTVSDCFIVKTGFDEFGSTTCEVRCYNVEKFGDCLNGVCTPPQAVDQPVFNPADPNACDDAIDPPF